MSQRERGGYSVYHEDPLNRSNFLIFPNLNLQPMSSDPEVVRKRELIQTREFRQAQSLTIDRDLIRRAEYKGLMESAQLASSPLFPFYEKAWPAPTSLVIPSA